MLIIFWCEDIDFWENTEGVTSFEAPPQYYC
jgi:hypothetical protein